MSQCSPRSTTLSTLVVIILVLVAILWHMRQEAHSIAVETQTPAGTIHAECLYIVDKWAGKAYLVTNRPECSGYSRAREILEAVKGGR